MSKLLVPDELWELVEPLLPSHPYTPGVGKPRVSDRVCLTGILFVLKTGIPWEDFPQDRLLRHEAVEPLRRMVQSRRLAEAARGAPGEAERGRSTRPVDGGRRLLEYPGRRRWGKKGPSPVDRRKNGSKHHVIVDARGTPLATILTGANRHDVTQLLPLVEAIPPVRGRVGHPTHKPGLVLGDRGYDSGPHRRA